MYYQRQDRAASAGEAVSHYIDAEVSDGDIVGCLLADPALIVCALRKLADRKGAEGRFHKAALDCLLITEGDESPMGPAAWAIAFEQMDSVAQDHALAELKRMVPLHRIAAAIP